MSQPDLYAFRLRPADRFFFGGEQTFGSDNANYLVRSRHFPQQTSLLGALRYKLLECAGLLHRRSGGKVKNPVEADRLIGPASFAASLNPAGYGAIKIISPLFLWSGEEKLYPAPKDYGFVFSKITEAKSSLNGAKDFIPHIPEGYKPKDGTPTRMVADSGTHFDLDDLFQAAGQVGILKNYGGQAEEEGFYKQTFLRFKRPDLAFGFFAWLDRAEGQKLADWIGRAKSSPLPFGGERSVFFMEMEKVENGRADFKIPNSPYYQPGGWPGYKVMLLTDAFVKNTLYQTCDFAVSETIDFRNIFSEVSLTEAYFNLDKKSPTRTTGVRKSHFFQLLEKGSVFYLPPENLPAFEKEMQAAANFRRIGMNAYTLITDQATTNFFTPSIHPTS